MRRRCRGPSTPQTIRERIVRCAQDDSDQGVDSGKVITGLSEVNAFNAFADSYKNAAVYGDVYDGTGYYIAIYRDRPFLNLAFSLCPRRG